MRNRQKQRDLHRKQTREEKLKKFVKKVIVSRGTVTFLFYNGISISKEYSNGQPGNKPGWKQRKEG